MPCIDMTNADLQEEDSQKCTCIRSPFVPITGMAVTTSESNGHEASPFEHESYVQSADQYITWDTLPECCRVLLVLSVRLSQITFGMPSWFPQVAIGQRIRNLGLCYTQCYFLPSFPLFEYPWSISCSRASNLRPRKTRKSESTDHIIFPVCRSSRV